MSGLEGFHLSPQQRRLVALRQAGGGSAYVAAAVVRIEGALEVGRLAAALQTVAARHEIFHTVFARLPGMGLPLQVLDAGNLPVLETASSGATAAEELCRLSAEVQQQERGPLLRAVLVPAAQGALDLVLVLPSLCADGPTLSILLRRLFEAYDGVEAGAAEGLQYVDLALWQNDLLESGEASEERRLLLEPGLWTGREAALPVARQAEGRGFEPELLRLAVGPELSAAVDAAAARAGVGAAAVVLAAWLALLSRLTGGRELVVGVVLDGRHFAELEEAVGPLAKTLPLRFETAAGEPWIEALRAVSGSLESLAEWQGHFSLEQLAALAGGDGVPWFPVVFSWEGEAPRLAARGLTLRVERHGACVDRFDLALVGRREAGRLVLELRFDAAALRRQDVLPFGDRLLALLRAAVERPAMPLAELPVLGEMERRRWLVEATATARPSTLGATLTGLVEAAVEAHPDRIAVAAGTDEGGCLSFGELAWRGHRLARHLRRTGVERGTLVAVCLDRSPDLIVTLLAVLEAGGAYVPLDPTYPAERLELLAESAAARVLVTTSGLAARFSGLARVFLDDAGTAAALAAESGEPLPAPRPGPGDLAYVIYTSGSTGLPKGVMISHGAICNRLLWMQEEHPLLAGDRVLQKTPASFDASVWELFCPLLAGARLELALPGGHQDAEYMVRAVIERQISVLQLVPSALRMVLEVPDLDRCVSLRRQFSGGEALPAALAERFRGRVGAELINLYGPTEVSIDATSHTYGQGGEDGAVVPIGRPLANTRLFLLDAVLQPVIPGMAGELWVGGAGLAFGYHGRPDLTAERFVPDGVSGLSGERLYRTGDLARFRPDGAAEFLGRADQQVKIRGFRIEPGEVEAALLGDPAVQAAVVGVREAAEGDLRLAAWIVPREGGDPVAGLRERLRARLPEHLVPADFVVLAELPVLPNGKLDRAALLDLAATAANSPSAGAAGAAAPPELRTPVEDLLAGLWCEVLGRSNVRLDDNVFDLGAHSLLIAQVVSRLRDTFRVDLPMRALFDEPTVAGLSQRIESALRGGGHDLPPLERVARGGTLPVSSAQRRLWFLDQLDPGSTAYSAPMAFRLTGALSLPRLAASFDLLVERHETLRTTFPAEGGQPVQRIGPAYRVGLPLIDLAALPEAVRQREEERLLSPGLHPPFDLAAGPLLRVAAVRLAAREHLVLGILHHIVSDAWSTWVAVRELSQAYEALGEGRRPAWPELPFQYADFAVWQQRWLAGEELAGQVDYWRNHLAGAPPTLDLPTDFPRPAMASPAGALRTRLLSLELLERLRAVGRAERASLYMTLLAAWYVLLASLTGRRDLVVGTSVAARDRRELEGMIGFFVNVLALRTRLADDLPFAEILRQVRDTALEGYLRQGVPFDRLLEELDVVREGGRNPLFQVAFTFENAPGHTGRFGDLKLAALEMRFDTSVFDLALLMEETEGGLWSGMRYMTTLFRPATIDRWLEQLEVLLAAVAADPAIPVGGLLSRLAEDDLRRRREQEAALESASLGKLRARTRTATLTQG